MSKKNLVVLPFGKTSLRSSWIVDAEGRNFDVVILCYHTLEDDPFVTHPNVRSFTLLDFKWWMIADLFQQKDAALLTSYDNFYFLDDDIETNKEDINFIFKWFDKAPVMLAQPSLTYNSFMSWKALRHKRFSGYRYVSSVELMCPLMKRTTLQELMHTFTLTKSGWGVDLLWGKLVREKFGRNKIAVFDVVQVQHGKPVGKGELYEKLDTKAKAEEDFVREKFNLPNFKIRQLTVPENFIVFRFFTFLYFWFLKK